jgi:predicted membrane chloride channel (bestrophin family)
MLVVESTTVLSYIMPVFLTFILVSLDNIQDHLENPFDQVGEDDIKINAEKFIDSLEF